MSEAAKLTEELKQCPFCGKPPTLAARWILDGWANTVFCEVCEAQSGSRKTAAEAAQAWNTRSSLPPDAAGDVGSALGCHAYASSDKHLSGYRLTLGFDTLEQAQQAHQAVVDLGKRLRAAKEL